MPPKKRTARRKRSFRARGERHGNAKLTAQQVRAIRRDRATTTPPNATTVRNIAKIKAN